ncbi:hypothetical protein MMC17_009539 [Xylographa soralifera]|nr:hypothetical protein [Xylographa soralifera]
MQGLVPPPPGELANFVDPPTKQANNIALHVVMLSLVTIAVAIRVYTRTFITRKVELDDYLCILAFCLTCAYSALLLACGDYFLGHHIWDITLNSYTYGSRLEVFAEFVYLILSATIKLSCLILYRRIFYPSKTMRWLCFCGMAFIGAAYFAFFMASILDCMPVVRHWDPLVPGHCLPSGTTAYGSGALNVVTDIFVVFLPLRAIWRLQMKFSRKVKVMAVFGLGIVVVALSITRLAMTPLVFTDTDPTWTLFTFSIYSVLELYIGLICACSLAFPSFLDRYGPSLRRAIGSYTSILRTDRSRNRLMADVSGSVGSREQRTASGDTAQRSQYSIATAKYARLDEATAGLPMDQMVIEVPASTMPANPRGRAKLEYGEDGSTADSRMWPGSHQR